MLKISHTDLPVSKPKVLLYAGAIALVGIFVVAVIWPQVLLAAWFT